MEQRQRRPKQVVPTFSCSSLGGAHLDTWSVRSRLLLGMCRSLSGSESLGEKAVTILVTVALVAMHVGYLLYWFYFFVPEAIK